MKNFVSKFQYRDKKLGWSIFGLMFVLQMLIILGNVAVQDHKNQNTAQPILEIQPLNLFKKMPKPSRAH
ncbi:KGW motif small protein [Acinetobacter courvalinii]|uniref:KGW motif small protein n=1 Tax=Acinetobacter courvalinii TaxID=280147 RepID=UPI00289FE6E8|nr:KGW motif small protein [Acinetobacter courvalinii]